MKKMAQKTEKEETEFKVVPETIAPCINATTASASATATTTSSAATAGGVANSINREKSPRSRSSSSSVTVRSVDLRKKDDRTVVKEEKVENLTVLMKREVNRCLCCRRKVALTGFRCRCGQMFCSEHRYSDRHDCSYDYKAAGREAIARENPVVKAAKIIKI